MSQLRPISIAIMLQLTTDCRLHQYNSMQVCKRQVMGHAAISMPESAVIMLHLYIDVLDSDNHPQCLIRSKIKGSISLPARSTMQDS
jgi:hypothetical protein